jgi:SAM-dependent methyltransferase
MASQDPMQQPWVAYEPDLMPPIALMRQEGINVLEDWFRWAEEWSLLLRLYGRLAADSRVLEIGCGLGRIAFPLRYVLSDSGSYDGFEICRHKVEFLERTFHRAYPRFHFTWADIHNTYYNPNGKIPGAEYQFPYPDNQFNVVFAASVFTHMLPDAVARYFCESARVLKPNGRCVFSFFLLDQYRPGQPRPLAFAQPAFNFDHQHGDQSQDFAVAEPGNPEQMIAYRLRLIERMACKAKLDFAQPPLPGFWSGSTSNWISTQDLVILSKPDQAHGTTHEHGLNSDAM